MAKIYAVVKDGETLREVKTLTAAKKLAEEEGAEVLCDGVKVYPSNSVSESDKNSDPENKLDTETMVLETTKKTGGLYRLKSLMNVRSKPSLSASILNAKPAGSVVAVESVTNNWLHLIDGSYILYSDGKYAEPM